MEQTTMQSLLASDEERLRNTLRAGQSVDQSRELGVRTLSDELGALLLRYNASCVDDPERQAVADAMTAATGSICCWRGRRSSSPGRSRRVSARPGC